MQPSRDWRASLKGKGPEQSQFIQSDLPTRGKKRQSSEGQEGVVGDRFTTSKASGAKAQSPSLEPDSPSFVAEKQAAWDEFVQSVRDYQAKWS